MELFLQDLIGNESTDQCIEILQAHNWDIEVLLIIKFKLSNLYIFYSDISTYLIAFICRLLFKHVLHRKKDVTTSTMNQHREVLLEHRLLTYSPLTKGVLLFKLYIMHLYTGFMT